MACSIRPVERLDLEGLKAVLDSCELFPSEYLDEMIADYFTNPDTDQIWFTAILNNQPVAIGYCIPEKLTDGTYNLLAIGVSKEFQQQGIANKMMQYIEQLLKSKNARLLVVDTSSDAAQLAARNFYKKIGYKQEAVINDFWKDGEDKITFTKKL
ncbi:MAG: N-acetyltransferase [Chitinophagales bacterium]